MNQIRKTIIGTAIGLASIMPAKAQEKINQTVSEDRQKTNSLETELKALNADLKELNERVDNLMQLIIARCSAK
jgi:peptidoglycan hydrolase CwlO-like protein